MNDQRPADAQAEVTRLREEVARQIARAMRAERRLEHMESLLCVDCQDVLNEAGDRREQGARDPTSASSARRKVGGDEENC